MTGALFYCSSGTNPWYWTQKCRVSTHRSVVSDYFSAEEIMFLPSFVGRITQNLTDEL